MTQTRMICPKCKGKYMIRLERKGFVQPGSSDHGFLPLECYDCRSYHFCATAETC